jgi:hypothetical protein
VVQQLSSATAEPQASRTRNNRTRNNKTRINRPKSFPRFAHPAEADIAQWLTANGIRWQYEPTSFPLEIDIEGNLVQSFKPDFYLPDVETYIEMTTMRQALVTRKNQKFRRMRELYPETKVRLLYRRDVELIQTWYGGNGAYVTDPDAVPRFTESQITKRIGECAQELIGRYSGQGIQLIPVAGGEHFAHCLEQFLPRPEGNLLVNRQPILVTGAIGTGLSIHQTMRSFGDTSNLEIVTMIDRPTARLVDLPIAFSAFPVGAEWMVGCGLGTDTRSGLFAVTAELQ